MTTIELYPIPGSPRLKIVPGVKAREWMSPHAYRCLPITAANAYGWDIVLTEEVTFWWGGGLKPEDIKVIGDGELNAKSHFGDATITFAVGYSWKTEPGVQLMLVPPVNPKVVLFHTISAVIETDVLKYPWFLSIRAIKKGDMTLPIGTVLGRVVPIRIADVVNAEIAEKPEPEEYRLARDQHAKDRDETTKADPKAWLRFYHDQVTYPSVRAPEVDMTESDEDILLKNDIMAMPNFLTAEEAATVEAFFDIAPAKPQSLDYWAERAFDFRADSFEPALYKKLTDGIFDTVSKHYGKTFTMEHPQLTRWKEGDVMRPHSDFGAQGEFPDRDYAAIVYVTGDLEGGNIFMPTAGIEIAPTAGALVAFPGGKLFHGVRKIERGQRLTVITWFKDLGGLDGH